MSGWSAEDAKSDTALGERKTASPHQQPHCPDKDRADDDIRGSEDADGEPFIDAALAAFHKVRKADRKCRHDGVKANYAGRVV